MRVEDRGRGRVAGGDGGVRAAQVRRGGGQSGLEGRPLRRRVAGRGVRERGPGVAQAQRRADGQTGRRGQAGDDGAGRRWLAGAGLRLRRPGPGSPPVGPLGRAGRRSDEVVGLPEPFVREAAEGVESLRRLGPVAAATSSSPQRTPSAPTAVRLRASAGPLPVAARSTRRRRRTRPGCGPGVRRAARGARGGCGRSRSPSSRGPACDAAAGARAASPAAAGSPSSS